MARDCFDPFQCLEQSLTSLATARNFPTHWLSPVVGRITYGVAIVPAARTTNEQKAELSSMLPDG